MDNISPSKISWLKQCHEVKLPRLIPSLGNFPGSENEKRKSLSRMIYSDEATWSNIHTLSQSKSTDLNATYKQRPKSP